jgi:1,2-diacylglycerol 3-alpha-glucosyltransferase
MSSANRRLLAIQFRRFGPYHIARLASARKELEAFGWDVVGIETSSLDSTYQWDPEDPPPLFQIFTVFPGQNADTLSRRDIHSGYRRTLDQIKPDALAIAGWVGPDTLACLGWGRSNRRPVVLMSETRQVDSSPLIFKRLLKAWRLRGYSAALVGGQSHASYLRFLGFQRPICRGYDVVDNHYFTSESARFRADHPSPPRPYLLASNRFVPRKNLYRLLQAFHSAALHGPCLSSFPDLCLLGDGPQRATLVSLCQSLGLPVVQGTPWDPQNLPSTAVISSPRVFFPGFCQISSLPRFYAHALGFIHPALSEPWGLVINEAMACGLPVLCSVNGGAAEELVIHGLNGFKFDPSDTHSIAAAIHSLLILPPHALQRYGQEGLRRLEQSYPLSAFGVGLSELLFQLQ